MEMSVRERDEREKAMWRRGASGWERHQASLREKTSPVAEWLVEAVDPRPGMRVLELAAGPGETGFLIAARIAPEGRLLSTDQAPEMVEVARRRAAELGCENVDFAVLDAQALELDPESFDAAVCRWGYMLMSDPDEALRRTRRVLRAGGRLALATWDRPDRNLWMAAPVLTMVGQGVIAPPDLSAPNPFRLFDPEDLEQRLGNAGFGSARTDRVEFVQRYPSFEAYWEETFDLAAPLREAIDGLEPERADAVRAGSREILSQFVEPDGGLAIPASAVVAVATA